MINHSGNDYEMVLDGIRQHLDGTRWCPDGIGQYRTVLDGTGR